MGEFIGFIIIITGLSLLSIHLIRAAIGFNEGDTDTRFLHTVFAIVCVPLMIEYRITSDFDYKISNPHGVMDTKDVVIMFAGIGFASLIAFSVERISLIAERDGKDDSILMLLYFVGIALFALSRFYDIIMVRENFWVLFFPLAAVVGIIYAILENGAKSKAETVEYIPPTKSVTHSPSHTIEDLTHKDPREAFDVPPQRQDP